MPSPAELRQEIEAWIVRPNQKSLLASYPSLDEERSGFNYQEKLAEGFKYVSIILPAQAQFFLSLDEGIEAERDKFIEAHGGSKNIEFYQAHAGDAIVLFKE